jgi:branched-chain amino acid transport system substrate-binding protein
MTYKAVVRAGSAAIAVASMCLSGSMSRAAGEPPFEINAILPLTGQAAFLGKAAASTLSILEAKVNSTGGIRGRSIKFVVLDDASNPAVDVQLANDLIAKKVSVVLGPEISASCNALAPLFRNGPVMYCLSGAFHPERNGYVFTYGAQAGDAAEALVRYLHDRGLKRVAFLGSSDASGQDGELSFDQALARPENKDMVVVTREHFGISDQTVAAQLSKIKASGAQALFTWATGTPMGTIYRGIQDAGLEIPVTVPGQNTVNAMMKQYGEMLPKGFVANGMAFMVPDSLPRGMQKSTIVDFGVALKTATGERPDFGYTIAWDPASIVISAFKKHGLNATPQQLREYILGLRGWPGITGTYDFSDGNNRGIAGSSSVIMVRWDATKGWIPVSKYGGGL